MAGPTPIPAAGPRVPPRPYYTRSQSSQSKPSQPTTPPAPSQRSPVSPRSTSRHAHNPLTPLSNIAKGIQKIIETYNPKDQIRLALTEILGYAMKAAEEEAKSLATKDLTVSLEAKLTESSKQFAKSAERIEAVATEIQAKLAAVASTTTQLETTANSYKDALLKVPPIQHHSVEGQGIMDPALGRNADRKARQVLVDFLDDQMNSLSETAIKEKVTDAVNKVTSPAPPKDFTVEEVTKLRNNGLVILFGSKEVVKWLQDPEAELLFTGHLSNGASIRQRQHIILVPKIPITLDPSNEMHIREIEEANCLKEHVISKIRWIKPERRRKPDQRLAHATFSFTSAEVANLCIRDGLLVHRVKTYPSKMKQEPMQCLKCRKWGHFTNSCLATKDTCGMCGGDHWTNVCNETSKRHCASCNSNSHASWDRQCPEFLRRCTLFDESHPDNALKYFPTEEPWTKVIRPPKIPFADHFPTCFVVGSLPPPNNDKPRELPTRQVQQKQRRKRRAPPCAAGQTAITNYYGPSRSQARSEVHDSDEGEVGEAGEVSKILDLDRDSPHNFSFDGERTSYPP